VSRHVESCSIVFDHPSDSSVLERLGFILVNRDGVKAIFVLSKSKSGQFLLGDFTPGSLCLILAYFESEGVNEGSEEVLLSPFHRVLNKFDGLTGGTSRLSRVQVEESSDMLANRLHGSSLINFTRVNISGDFETRTEI